MKIVNIAPLDIYPGTKTQLVVQGLSDNLFPQVTGRKSGYILQNNLVDSIGSTGSLSFLSPLFVRAVGETGLEVVQDGNGPVLPSTVGYDDVVGNYGTNHVTWAIRFYIGELPATDNRILLFGGFDKFLVRLKANGKISWGLRSGDVFHETVTGNSFVVGWNVLVINYEAGGDNNYIRLNGVNTAVATTVPFNPGTGTIGVIAGSGPRMVIQRLFYAASEPAEETLAAIEQPYKPSIELRRAGSLYSISSSFIEANSTATDDFLKFTIPTNVPPSRTYIASVKVGPFVTEEFYLTVKQVPTTKDISWQATKDPHGKLFDQFYGLNKEKGGVASGGMIPQYIEALPDDRIQLKANGDIVLPDSLQGVVGPGTPKVHDAVGDPKLGQPWKNRVGSGFSSARYTGYGEYNVRMNLLAAPGVSHGVWIEHEIVIDNKDSRWTEFLNQGLTPVNGLLTRKHFISLDLYRPVVPVTGYGVKARCTTGVGINTNEMHIRTYDTDLIPGTLAVDIKIIWAPGKVDFLLNGILIHTSTKRVPNTAGIMGFGLYFPSAPVPYKPWLASSSNFVGGVTGTEGNVIAAFGQQSIRLEKVNFKGSTDQVAQLRGETNPFWGVYDFGGSYFPNAKYEFDVSEGDVGTVVFCMDQDRWRGVDSYESEKISGIGNDLYSHKEGKLWKHNMDGEGYNRFYGIQRSSELSLATNTEGGKVGTWQTISVEAGKPPDITYLKDSADRESNLTSLKFSTREQIHYAAILRAGEGVKLVQGPRLRGTHLFTFLSFKAVEHLQIKAINIGWRNSAGHEQV